MVSSHTTTGILQVNLQNETNTTIDKLMYFGVYAHILPKRHKALALTLPIKIININVDSMLQVYIQFPDYHPFS